MNTEIQGTIAKETVLLPVVNNIFAASAEDSDRFELVGGRCDACDDYSFPKAEHCYHCHADTRKISLGSDGIIYSFTLVRTKPPLGLPQPYAVAYIDLKDAPLRVFCLLDPEQTDDAVIGAKVRLSVGPLGINNAGQNCLRPFFQLLPNSKGA
jgi:uncharacterized OB-fold protein